MTEPSQQSAETSLQGGEPPLATPQQRAEAIDRAFDYRGDVTIHTTGGRTVAGYVFDRSAAAGPPFLRIMPGDGSAMVRIEYDQVQRLVFTGRDTASGKSWETWVKQHEEKKARGESANLYPDELD